MIAERAQHEGELVGIGTATAQFRRALQSWWADGWDLLLTPTVAELPLPLGTIANNPDHPMDAMERSGRFIARSPSMCLAVPSGGSPYAPGPPRGS